MVTLSDIQAAQQHVHQIAHETPVDYSQTLSEQSGMELYLKLENLQKTGSFKIRGAYHKIMSLSAQQRANGVVAASAGNHAQGVALAASKAGISCTVVMPEGAPLAKAEATRRYGAKVILEGHSFDDALQYALDVQREKGATFVHAFDDAHTIAGQGTVGLELLEQIPDLEAIVCPIGGGGLIAGISIAVKTLNPAIKVYGVQAASCASMAVSIDRQCPVQIESPGTIADGIAVKKPGEQTFDIVQNYVDDIVTVDELALTQTMLFLMERNKLVVEGSGAASVAALRQQKIPHDHNKVAAIISGGNVDIHLVSRVIQRGLVDAGRYLTIRTIVSDKPGNLNRLLNIITDLDANILSVHHHRISAHVMPGQTEIELSLETKDEQHIAQIETTLHEQGYQLQRKK